MTTTANATAADPFLALAADYTRAQLALIGLARQLGSKHQHEPLATLIAAAPDYSAAHRQLAALANLMADVTSQGNVPSGGAAARSWTSPVAQRLAALAARLGLSPTERVLLAALVAIDAGMVLNPHLEPGSRQAPLGALDAAGAALLASRDPRAPDSGAMAALRPYSPLCRAGVVALHAAAGAPWAQHTVRIADELMDWLQAGVYPRTAHSLRVYTEPAPTHDVSSDDIAALAAALRHPLVVIDDRSDLARHAMRDAAATAKKTLIELDATQTHGALLQDAWSGAKRIATTADAVIAVYLTTDHAHPDPDRPRHAARSDLAPLMQSLPTYATVVFVAEEAPAWATAMPHVSFEMAHTTPRFDGLATRVTHPATWASAVFDGDTRVLLQDVIDACRFQEQLLTTWGFAAKLPYGRAVSALLAGPPGTGKTMSAALIANELGRPLYRVDLARIVSKYIGETEKQLQRVFDEAEASGAILLFDEADALFAKRTEVKSSNDRHANLEVNFLLQRLETFGGVVLLTTNHEHLIDVAFKRRLRYRVPFAAPDAKERLALWMGLIPPDAHLADDVDVAFLAARFPLSGGHMLNALVRAASRALAANGPISQHHLIESCQLEYAASGRV